MSSEPVGQLLKKARLKRGWSQAKLGYRVEMNPSYISRLENGEIADPGFGQVRRIVEALGVTWGEVFNGVAHVSPETSAQSIANSSLEEPSPKGVDSTTLQDVYSGWPYDPRTREARTVAAMLREMRMILHELESTIVPDDPPDEQRAG